ncbi:MAG: single-stranded-DNA-specific exonuclease RecJ [Bacteroidales bacterium]|nr:single-stranded-DNA-specific exonuclease RecJ [Bacteroidales bacterium]
MMKSKRWIIRKDYDIKVVERLAESLGVDKIIATLLVERGITSFDEARCFFRPSLDQIHNPFLMKDMDRAIRRIDEAISRGERIMIYGDYDVDGTSAVALLYSYLGAFYSNIDFYIPDRDTEGSGISYQGINTAHESGVKLMIALDCGINAVEQVDYAAERGIDFIIGDHHLLGNELPRAVAVLDPKRPDCPYPYKELSGCGISFKIVEAHLESRLGVRLCDDPATLNSENRHLREQMKLRLLKYLDLVALSIASDLVPIMGENRVLAHYGLRVINTRPRPGIEAILGYGHVERKSEKDKRDNPADTTYFRRELTVSDLIFLIGPRLNAAGRLHSAYDSVRLLLCDNLVDARRLATEIDSYNQDRKQKDTEATETAKKRVEASPYFKERHSIVLFDETWHKGVVGIVASRLVEAYYKPTIVFTRSTDDIIVGSARSFKDFDIHSALERCADLLEHFGGHRCAAGVTIRAEKLEAFIERFEQVVIETMPEESATPYIEIDAEVNFSEQLTPKFMRILKQFAPFGPENNIPVFLSHNLVDYGTPPPRIVGRNHLRFSVISLEEGSKHAVFPAIGFNLGEYYGRIQNGEHFSMCYMLEENHWNGHTEMQLRVKDLSFDDE